MSETLKPPSSPRENINPLGKREGLTNWAFVILDPRPIPAASATNEAIFASGPVYGVEVTVPALVAKCVDNIDPQHSEGDATSAAIEEALKAELPPNGATLATIRADLDSVGTMTVLLMRAHLQFWKDRAYNDEFNAGEVDEYNAAEISTRERELEQAMTRIKLVAESDKFARGGWPGPKSLPTREHAWNDKIASAESSRPLAIIAAAISDFKISLIDRVNTMEQWLKTGEEPEQYVESVEKERLGLISAIENGEIKHEKRGDIAVVESTHRAATSIGYSLAPVVVALNPSFKQGPGEPYKKFTICAFEDKFADIKGALAELSTLEPGWGGSPTIGGSPQGVSSKLTIDQVVGVLSKYLKKV